MMRGDQPGRGATGRRPNSISRRTWRTGALCAVVLLGLSACTPANSSTSVVSQGHGCQSASRSRADRVTRALEQLRRALRAGVRLDDAELGPGALSEGELTEAMSFLSSRLRSAVTDLVREGDAGREALASEIWARPESRLALLNACVASDQETLQAILRDGVRATLSDGEIIALCNAMRVQGSAGCEDYVVAWTWSERDEIRMMAALAFHGADVSVAGPRLMQMAVHDPSVRVRENAAAALHNSFPGYLPGSLGNGAPGR